jgi:hypothetical protein
MEKIGRLGAADASADEKWARLKPRFDAIVF